MEWNANMSELSCTNCGLEAPTTQQQGNFLDNGWSLNWLALGHYGGFTDCVPDSGDEWDAPKYIFHLCHDCCLTMVRALPALAKLIGAGHPNMNTGNPLSTAHFDGIDLPPCCEHAWTFSTSKNGELDTYFATPDLKWVKQES